PAPGAPGRRRRVGPARPRGSRPGGGPAADRDHEAAAGGRGGPRLLGEMGGGGPRGGERVGEDVDGEGGRGHGAVRRRGAAAREGGAGRGGSGGAAGISEAPDCWSSFATRAVHPV